MSDESVREWPQTASKGSIEMNAERLDSVYAPADLRDQFLHALDAGDHALSRQLAQNLIQCMNPLPGITREELGLPIGSTYGTAARQVLDLEG